MLVLTKDKQKPATNAPAIWQVLQHGKLAFVLQAPAEVREASKRVLGLRHFDVQLLGASAAKTGGTIKR